MSFSSEVKEELSGVINNGRHCQIAETAAILTMCGEVAISEKDNFVVKIQTENLSVARKYFTLLRKAFNIEPEVAVKQGKTNRSVKGYMVVVKHHKEAIKLLEGTKLLNSDLEIMENLSITSNLVMQQMCCRRAFIRGSFLAAGSISDPNKFYHYEIACQDPGKAEQLRDIICSFELDAKIVERKKHFVVYVKEGAQIVDLLNIMGAHVSLMNLENVRILKEMRNSVNRKVNCETANINKTVSAAVKQAEDIQYIQQMKGLNTLPESLQEIARLRLEQPEATLKELGMMLAPQVGKSGVNHRLRKLSTIAEELRKGKEEDYYD